MGTRYVPALKWHFLILKKEGATALYLQIYLLTRCPNSLRVPYKERRYSGPSDRRKSALIVFVL